MDKPASLEQSQRGDLLAMQDDRKIVTSHLSGLVTQNGISVDVMIYSLEDGDEWSLEVVDPEGTSTVWDDLFSSAEDAHAEFVRTLKDEGISCFLRDPAERPH